MVYTSELYRIMQVLMTLNFNQGHRLHENPNFYDHSVAKFSVDLGIY